jgi:4-hydroxybenzoate polyprenyltransferase
VEKFKIFLRMIKIEHTLFALPFAFTGAVIAADGLPTLWQTFWIIIAMLGGRSGAMGLNRVVDAEFDAKNPRTANREIPAGNMSKKEGYIYVLISFLVFIFAAKMLNPLCFKLSPIAVFIFVLYSYTKRFTYLCHIILGVAIGLAPIGAWIAIKGDFNFGIIMLGIGVLIWVAGFDIMYSIQDIDFDKKEGLFSIPVNIGITNSLYLARIMHLIAFLIFIFIKFYFGLGIIYLIGILISGLLMAYEHMLVKPDDLSKLDMAFFNLNAYISLTIFIFTFIDIIF